MRHRSTSAGSHSRAELSGISSKLTYLVPRPPASRPAAGWQTTRHSFAGLGFEEELDKVDLERLGQVFEKTHSRIFEAAFDPAYISPIDTGFE
jgi:hypothetical protein